MKIEDRLSRLERLVDELADIEGFCCNDIKSLRDDMEPYSESVSAVREEGKEYWDTLSAREKARYRSAMDRLIEDGDYHP